MVCKSCGNTLSGSEKFCRFCGAVVEKEAYADPFAYNGPADTGFYGAGDPRSAGKPPKRRGKGLLIGGIVAAVVLVLAAVAVVLVLGNPSVRVASALSATAKEFASVSEAVGLGKSAELLKQEQLSQDLELKISSVNEAYVGSGAAVLNGVGFRLESDVNLGSREMGMRLVPYLGSVELCTLTISAEDEVLYFALPELFPDPCYGINTVTMMQDLQRMGADLGEYGDISFNYFDLVELIRSRTEPSEESLKKLDDATKNLGKKLKVEKSGTESIQVNGTKTKCTVYDVTLPKGAVKQWISALEGVYGGVDSVELMEEVLTEVGLPQSDINELVRGLSVSSGNPFDALYDLVDELGDVELEVYISGGKISAVRFEDEVNGSDVEVGLYLGGGDNYADDLSLVLRVDDEEISIVSHGDHTAEKGKFKDRTSITVPYQDEILLLTEYNTGDGSFSLELTQENTSFTLEGTLVSREDRLELDIEDLSMKVDGDKIITLRIQYLVTDYSRRVSLQGARMLSDMTQEDILEFADALETNTTNWLIDLIVEHPELMDLL